MHDLYYRELSHSLQIAEADLALSFFVNAFTHWLINMLQTIKNKRLSPRFSYKFVMMLFQSRDKAWTLAVLREPLSLACLQVTLK